MKKFYIYIAIMILTISEAYTQSFRVLSFEEDLTDLTAIRNPRNDVNENKCAIIKIYTNLDELFFETRLGIEGDVVKKTGEYWIYVSPKEKQIKIIKKGFIPLEYSIPITINESAVYKMTLTGTGITGLNDNQELKTEFVLIETDPIDAQIFIDDKLKGVSPLTFPLQEGKYVCKIEKPLYKTMHFELNVVAGNTILINKTLSELDIYGNIEIKTDEFADIYIDNKKVATGYYSGRIIEGLHIIEIKADNYKGFSREILIIANKDYNFERYLEAKTGTISIQSSPYQTSIFIDGEFYGTTPKFIRDIKVGNRQIILEKEGYASISEKIEVFYDKTAEYNYELKPGRLVNISTTPAGADIYLNNVVIGSSPLEFFLDYTRHNKIKIIKDGYHTIFDEIPQDNLLKEKSYKLEKLSKTPFVVNVNKPGTRKTKNTNYKEKRTILGWTISGMNARPGGISSSMYVNFGENSQYAAFIDGAYQQNDYENNLISSVVKFPRYSFGVSYNLWLRSTLVMEAFASVGREYGMGLNWKSYGFWEYPPDVVYTKTIKTGVRIAFRISPHVELFGAYNLNFTDGPAFDIWNNQVSVGGTRYNYQQIFPDRDYENIELGLRFVIY